MLSKRLVALVGVPLLLLIAACGGGGDDNGSGNNAAPTATTAPSGGAQPTATSSAGGTQPTQPAGAGTVTVSITGACDLATKQDAAAALGEAVGDPQQVAVTSQDLGAGVKMSIAACNFNATGSSKSVSVTYWKLSGGDATSVQIRQLFSTIICAGKESVSGLGDSACWDDSDHRELQVLKGAAFIYVQINEATGPDRTAALRSLAQKALAKLP